MESINIMKNAIEDIISSLPLNKATGPDKISHKLLKKTVGTVSEALCHLFNKSLLSSTYPSEWKKAHVMPLLKKAELNLASNYRPISLISCVGKLFERVVFKHLYNYFLSNKLLYKYQSGFQVGHSTVH